MVRSEARWDGDDKRAGRLTIWDGDDIRVECLCTVNADDMKAGRLAR